MTLKKTTFVPKNRRGLSSVVGALFFTVLMIAGFSVLSLALDAQTDIVTTQRIVFDIEIKKQQEQFGIIASTDGNDLLTVSVNNLHVSQYFCPCEYLFPTSGFFTESL